jgi:nicotinamide mononucleotide transporter
MDEFFNSIINEFNWSLIEILAVLFSIIYVALAAKENIFCWVAAFVSVSLYIYICFEAKLYAETALQIFYFIMAIWGYFSWKNNKKKLTISEWSIKKHLKIIFFGTLITFILGFVFSTFSKAEMPIIDSFTTVFSILATYMIVKKVLSNWLYFIIIDLASIYIYFSRDLHLSSILFLLYTIIAVYGYIKWSRLHIRNE